MPRRLAAPLVLILLTFSLSGQVRAFVPGMPRIILTDSQYTCPDASTGKILFSDRAEEIHLLLAVPHSESARVTFIWTDPSGNVFARNVKLGFRGPGDDELLVRDFIKPKAALGWWTVEAVTEGEYLSADFLLSDNRQVWTSVYGNVDARNEAVGRADPENSTGMDIIRLATFDPAPEVRRAALGKLDGVEAGWAGPRIRELLYDQDASVRLAAVGLLDALTPAERESVYLFALSSPGPEVRLKAVRGLVELEGPKVEAGLLRMFEDPDARVRYAAFSGLVKMGSTLYAPKLPALAADRDRGVAGLALDEALRLADRELSVRSLVSAANGAFRDLALKAVDALAKAPDALALDVYLRYFREGYDRPGMIVAMSRVPGPEPVRVLAEAYGISGRDEAMRLNAVRGLARRGKAAEPALTLALGDASLGVRIAAVESAGTMDDPSSRGRVLGAALGDANLKVRSAALAALTKAPAPETVLYLLDALGDEELRGIALDHIAADDSGRTAALLAERAAGIPDAGFRARVVKVLADAGARPDMLAPFVLDKSQEVALCAVEGLSTRDGVDAVAGLMSAGSSPEGAVRSAAMEALSGRTDADIRSGVEEMFGQALPGPLALSFMVRLVRDPALLDIMVRYVRRSGCDRLRAVVEPLLGRTEASGSDALLSALGYCGRPLDIAIIDAISKLGDDPDGSLLLEAWRLAPQYSLDILDAAVTAGRTGLVMDEALVSEDASVRVAAVRALRADSGLDAQGALKVLLRDPDEAVRLAAARKAAGMGLYGILADAAGDADPDVRTVSVTGLSLAGTRDAYEKIASLVPDGDAGTAGAALEALSSAGPKVPGGLWAEIALGSGSPGTARFAAVKTLADLNDPAYAGTLAEMLGGYGDDISVEAARGLVAIGAPALDHVYGMIGDPETMHAALDVVEGIADPSSSNVLAGILPGVTGTDRLDVIAALGRLGGEAAVAGLVDAYATGGPDVRLAAIKALADTGADGADERVAGIAEDALRGDDTMRFYGAHLAGELGVAAASARLEELAESDPSGLVRRQASIALGKLSRPASP